MTRPAAYLARMLLFLVAVGVVVALLSRTLITFFGNNPLLNGLIVCVLAIGVLWNLRQVARLEPEARWVGTLQRARQGIAPQTQPPRLLAPMAAMLAGHATGGREGSERLTLSAAAMRSLLDSIASRLEESRELSRYMVGLLIFLGLLGTFWGLLLTVGSVGNVINGMSVGSGDINAMFGQLKSGLAGPLRGMGTAFSSSMLGLSGALVLGFLDLTAGQAQNRFYNELEEWLAGLTRLTAPTLEGDGAPPLYLQALLEQTAENLDAVQRLMARGEDGRQQVNTALLTLGERVTALTELIRTQQQLMLRQGEALQRLGERRDGAGDEAARYLRGIEASLQRLLTESEHGRAQSTAELRSEIRVLTRTLASLAEEAPH